MRYGRSLSALGVVALSSFATLPDASAVTSSRSVPSSFGGNGHNISFDGRLLLVRDSAGWQAQLVRPEATTYLSDGLPDASGPMLSPRVHVFGDPTGIENALAICEPDPTQVPFACDAAGAPNGGGPFDCYTFWLLDSDAITPVAQGGFVMRRRQVTIWVGSPKTVDAYVDHWSFGAIEPITTTLMGIEPTVTRDGKLMVYQGHPDNLGEIDILMYTVNDTPCAASGWAAPKMISNMHLDPAVVGKYPLAERKLRAADGQPFDAIDLFHGGYPWLMPDGEAIIFAATPMPCRAPEDPPGCGPRRNALSVIGYPTNWGVAHIDGGANPSTTDDVRLFFSSPGPNTFTQFPATPGQDVWPFFGSNTSNYVELVFDDGLDGNYAGFWHLNENVGHDGEMDKSRTPDVSGYYNTMQLQGGLTFADANDGIVGKSLAFDGVDDRLVAVSAASLSPANGITIDFWIQPASGLDCDGANNWRRLIGKGDTANGAYTVVLEEGYALQTRVNVDGVQQSIISPPLAVDQWNHVAIEYDGATGKAGVWIADVQVTDTLVQAGTLTPTDDDLTIGAPGARAACPDGDGAFAGRLDEVAISRFSRHWGQPPDPIGTGGGEPTGATTTGAGAGGPGATGAGGGSGGDDATGGDGGCSCRTSTKRDDSALGLWMLGLGLTVGARSRFRRAERR